MVSFRINLVLFKTFTNKKVMEIFLYSWVNAYLKRVLKKISAYKVHIFWEGHKILLSLHLAFDYSTYSQKKGEDFAKFCGLLRIYELYKIILSPLIWESWRFSCKKIMFVTFFLKLFSLSQVHQGWCQSWTNRNHHPLWRPKGLFGAVYAISRPAPHKIVSM